MSLNKDGTYKAHGTQQRQTGWECYRHDCTKTATGLVETASGATHRACDDHKDKVCTCGALDVWSCLCNLTANEFSASRKAKGRA